MLVPFVIDADSLNPDASWSPSLSISLFSSLFKEALDFGLLMHDKEIFSDSNLHSAVKNVPEKIRPLWTEFLEQQIMIPLGLEWDGLVTKNSVAMLSSKIALAFIDNEKAEIEFKFTEVQNSLIAESFELCRISAASTSKKITKAKTLSGSRIKPKETYQAIWNDRFLQLASSNIKNIHIVDRFAIGNFIKVDQHKLSGLERFLKLLDQCATQTKSIHLYSAWVEDIKDYDIEKLQLELKSRLEKHLGKQKIPRIKLYMTSNHDFGIASHDRFVRFDNFICDIGIGLGIFEGPICESGSVFSFKGADVKHDYIETENNLKNCNSAQEIIIRLS